jgi:hypothetical protein
MKKLFILLLPTILLCGALTRKAAAQDDTASLSSNGFIGWNVNQPKSSDVAVTAIIREVVPNHASGIPAGLHLMLGTPQGVLDASVGPYLAPSIQQALSAGQQIQVIGQVKTIHDQKYLLVRHLVLNGNEIVIRSDNGSFVRGRAHERRNTQPSLNDQNGGIQ